MLENVLYSWKNRRAGIKRRRSIRFKWTHCVGRSIQ